VKETKTQDEPYSPYEIREEILSVTFVSPELYSA